MKEIQFSTHALERLAQYRITQEDVQHAFEHPLEEQPGREGSLVLIGLARNGDPLRIVFNDKVTPGLHFIITLHWFTRAKKWST